MIPLPRFVLALLGGLTALASVAPAQPAPSAPAIPPTATAHWHSGKTLQRSAETTALDVRGNNHFTLPAWASISPSGGFTFTGLQPDGIRLVQRHPVSTQFLIGVDLKPDADGAENQSIVYLFGFCELRYRLPRQELQFNIWQTSLTEPGKQLVSTVRLPLPAGKWTRVEATIDQSVARLRVGATVTEIPLPGNFDTLRPDATVFIARGADRPYKGSLNHLFFADLR